MSQDLAVPSERDRTLELATFFSNLTFEELPSRIIDHAKLSILNSIGCGLSGAPLESHGKMLSVLDIVPKQGLGGPFSAATILGRPERACIEDAAMLNGMAMTARFFDDTHLGTVVHPSGPPLAALLAHGEAHYCSGRDVLLAFIVGVETMLAFATALGLKPYKRGWHATSITGTFGAAAAIAKIMKLPPTKFAQVLGHASSMAAGTRGVFGTDSLSMHAGRAAQNGLLAARMAKEGLGSTTHALEKWVKLIRHDDKDSASFHALTGTISGNDREWMILENTFKPYPCGIVIHPAIDAGVKLHPYFFNQSTNDTNNNITQIQARVTPLTIRLCGIRHPKDATETIFSTYHGIAIGLIYGKAGIREFSMDVVNDRRVQSLRNRIALTPDDTLEDDQAALTVEYRDAKMVEQEKGFFIEHAMGSLKNPMTDEQLKAKFADQASIGGIDSEAVERAMGRLLDLETVEDIASIVKYFVPPVDSTSTQRTRRLRD